MGGVVRTRLVETDGPVRLFVAETAGPSDRTLLVIHGGPDWDHSYLLDPLTALAPAHRVVFPDLRGCGRSTRGLGDDRYGPEVAVADLVALLDRLELTAVDVLGFSYGGMLAQRLALAAPGRVRCLIVASSTVLPVPEDAFTGWLERDRRRAEEAAVWADPALSGIDLVRAAAFAGAPANVWRSVALPGYLRRLADVRFSADWLSALRAGRLGPPLPADAASRLRLLDVPILLLHGRYDMTFPAALAEEAAALLPTGRAVVLADSGHMAHVDHPAQWLQAIADIL